MTTKERIFHSLLFEVVGLIVLVPIASVLSGVEPTTMTGLAVVISIVAMCWNFGYNLIFDNLFGHQRIQRGWLIRVGHSIGFEAGLLCFSLPLLMWVTGMGLVDALILDIGMMVFYLVFTIGFNWCYDHGRHHWVNAS